MELKEKQQKLNDMEGAKRDVEKEKEQLLVDLKLVQKRLETEKTRADTLQHEFNVKECEL